MYLSLLMRAFSRCTASQENTYTFRFLQDSARNRSMTDFSSVILIFPAHSMSSKLRKMFNRAKRQVDRMMKRQKKYRFSVLGLILCRLSIPFHRKHFYFCSEFVGSILEDSNALSLPKDPSLMRPNDYSKFSDMSCKFEGRLNTLLQQLGFSSVPIYSSRSSRSIWSIVRIGSMIPFIGGR